MRRSTYFHTLLGAAALSIVAATAQAQDIKLGFNGDLSASPSALSGQAATLGLQAAIEDINAAGGVLGRKLTLVVRDDLSQPPKSIQNMSELIDSEKVVAVFGPTNSGNALAWKHIPTQKKIPVIGTVGSATAITYPVKAGAENYMFRVSMVDREQVAGLMAYVKKNPTTKNVGYLAETTGYGQGGLKDIQELGDLQGIKPACNEKFGVNDTDMTSQLNKCKAAGVDTIVVWAQGTPLGQLMRSMEKINYFPTTLMSWAADNQSFYEAAGKSLAERPIFMRTVTEDRSPAQQKLYDRLAAKMTSPSSFGFAAHSYDAVTLLAAAMKQANSTDGVKVREALENLQGTHDGIMKTYTNPFSPTVREALTSKDYRWTHWKDGKLVAYSDDVIKSLSDADFKM
ncbi:ABC transporter substrate-binding protein [Microvirga tunisiensis]|uniref:ABC transporter substrate-binding protein n=1 Tax=Microvirga tunisiensis TaxID=2108360 RepID=A0A5N7MAV7_9HYPH|nr:ABC transporter substrate-binding protein [Microvirga tunisiensis]MPR05570.1 ABC transporter substrate-binding protein [Microvirga tunisiensis]MPR23770.1 ABC transporter substrate-binding protein [Microvirga tunisiensis]